MTKKGAKQGKAYKAKGKGKRKVPGTPHAPVRSDVGVLFVHGIGKQKEGRVLDAFGDPLKDSIASRLAGGGTLVQEACHGCKIAGEHGHFVTTEFEGESSRLTTWVFAECYWDDVIDRVDVTNFNGWIARVSPMLILWQTASSAIGGFHRRIHEGQTLNPLAWYAWLCSLFWSTVLRSSFSICRTNSRQGHCHARAGRPSESMADVDLYFAGRHARGCSRLRVGRSPGVAA